MDNNENRFINSKFSFRKLSKTKMVLLALIALFLLATVITNLKNSAAARKEMPVSKSQDQSAQIEANTVTVSAKTIIPETIRSTVKINGEVESKSSINIYPDTSGKVTEIVKGLGASVKKGEIIAYVDPSKPGSAYAVNPVVSTVTGTVISMPVNPGDTVSTSTVIGAVGSLRDLKITVYVSEKYSGYLKKGLNAFVSFTSMPGEEFSAKVTSVSPVVNNSNRTVETVLELDKYDSRIKPGMYATVSLVIQEEDNSFVVPKSAIKTYNTDSTVFVIDENNTAKRVVVTTGISNDNDIQITSGLEEGMQVITAGSATEGSPIKIAGGNK